MQGGQVRKAIGVLMVLCSGLAVTLAQPDQPGIITSETIDDLELGFVTWNHFCEDFSQDDRLLGSYDLQTGQPYFAINHYVHGDSAEPNVTILAPERVRAFAPESQIDGDGLSVRPAENLLIIQRLGAFELHSGRRLLDMYGWSSLSQDGSLLAIPGIGIYNSADGSLALPLSDDENVSIRISPNNQFYAVSGDGVYELATGERRFAIAGVLPEFSPDGRWLAAERDGVYDVQTGERLIALENAPFASPRFSPDSRWLADAGAIFDMATGEKLFDMDIWNEAVFSPDSRLVVGADGVYDVPSGERLFELSGARVSFSADGSLIAASDGRIHNVETGEVVRRMLDDPTFSPGGTLLSVNPDAVTGCFIYGLSDHPFPYRSGLVQPNAGVNIRRSPFLSADVLRSTGDLLVVTARNDDGTWYKVLYDGTEGWVSAEAVSIVEMPDGVPVEGG